MTDGGAGPGNKLRMDDGVPRNPGTAMGTGSCVRPQDYNVGMRFVPGRVGGGRVEFVGTLPEGTSVAVVALESDRTFEADAETEAVLLRAIVQCNRGRTTPMADVLSEMRGRE